MPARITLDHVRTVAGTTLTVAIAAGLEAPGARWEVARGDGRGPWTLRRVVAGGARETSFPFLLAAWGGGLLGYSGAEAARTLDTVRLTLTAVLEAQRAAQSVADDAPARWHTWADAWGVWHVRVFTTQPLESSGAVITARKALREKLTDRQGAPVAREVWANPVRVPAFDMPDTASNAFGYVWREGDNPAAVDPS